MKKRIYDYYHVFGTCRGLGNLKNFQLTLSGFFFLFQFLSQSILLDPIFKEVKWTSQKLHSTNLDFFEIYKNLNYPLLSMIFLWNQRFYHNNRRTRLVGLVENEISSSNAQKSSVKSKRLSIHLINIKSLFPQKQIK